MRELKWTILGFGLFLALSSIALLLSSNPIAIVALAELMFVPLISGMDNRKYKEEKDNAK